MATKTATAAATTVKTLWESSNGTYCETHARKASRYFAAEVKARPKARKIITTLDVWEKINYTTALRNLEAFNASLPRRARRMLPKDISCDVCFATFPENLEKPKAVKKVVKTTVKVSKDDRKAPEGLTAAQKRQLVAGDVVTVKDAEGLDATAIYKVVVAPEKIGARYIVGLRVYGTRRKMVTVPLTAVVNKTEAPKKTVKKVAKTAPKVAKSVTPAPKKVAKKPEAKKALPKTEAVAETGVQEFYAVKFTDGYFLRTKTTARITYTASFREARQFKTYDAALKVEGDIRENYDYGNVTLFVVKVSINHDDPKKTSVRRVGTLIF